jgi:alkylated DNA nucleotide flippase Atl1
MFDRFVIVDWSSRSVPCSGPDSVWVAVLDAAGELKTCNPSTRGAAEALIRGVLCRAVGRGERVLVGFDFPYGYPEGFAAALGLPGLPWRATWDRIAGEIHDDRTTNANDRFEVAARLNERLPGHVFWGRPASRLLPGLSARRDRVIYGNGQASGPAEWRRVEAVLRAAGQHPQPAWKLYGNGSVGAQTLVGIPVLARLRDHAQLSSASSVWPFEGQIAELPVGRAAVVHAEIWPSMIHIDADSGRVKDEVQVASLASVYRQLDQAGSLAQAFAATPVSATLEEGWILGVGHPALGRTASALTVTTTLPPSEAGSGEQTWATPNTIGGALKSPSTTLPTLSSPDAKMDLERAQQFVAAVPKGRWTAYKDVAIAAGNEQGAQRIGQWLRHSDGRIPNYWRVLNVEGLVPDAFVGGGTGPREPVAARALLRNEGVIIDAAGRAIKAQRFTVRDWHPSERTR